jgi:hypothetical protein
MFEEILAEANRIDVATKKKRGNTDRFMAGISRIASRDHFGEPKAKPREKPCRVCHKPLYTEGEKRNIPPLRYKKYDFICKSCNGVRIKIPVKKLTRLEVLQQEIGNDLINLSSQLTKLIERFNDYSKEATNK